jgi:hypothetical protein
MMLTLIDKSVKVEAVAGGQLDPCPDNVYDAWIKSVHDHGTTVHAGETYVWLYVQLMPPRLVNCVITVREGD